MKLIGVCGISGSGKSYLIEQIKMGLDEVSVLSLDDYYRPISEQEKDSNGFVNFDLPTSINSNLLLEHIGLLQSGKSVTINRYLFNNKDAEPTQLEVRPNKVLIVEGIFILGIHELRSYMDLIMRIEHQDEEGVLDRRISRDVKERGMTVEMVKYQWDNHVIPGYEKFIKPYEALAQFVLKNDFETDNMVVEAKEIIKKMLDEVNSGLDKQSNKNTLV